jgi:hypothetical protein
MKTIKTKNNVQFFAINLILIISLAIHSYHDKEFRLNINKVFLKDKLILMP